VEIIAAIIPAFFFAPILTVLHEAYGIGTGLPAPQAGLFAGLTEGFFGDGELPMGMIAIGAAIGVALILLDGFLKRAGSTFRAHVMPVAVGIYLPFAVAPPLLVGGLLRYFLAPRDDETGLQDRGILLGSGLIAGEAIMGILLAIVIASNVELPELGSHWLPSLLAFGAVVAFYAWVARRSASEPPASP
jgi:putative OPT family oligopeptide transporter